MTEKIIWSKKPLYFSIKCNKCSSIVEFSPPAVIPQQVKVGCYKCQAINTVEKEQLSHFEDAESLFTSSSPTNGTRSGGKRSRGTNENPLSTEFYDLLEVSPTATQAEIKKKYYVLAMKYHPDKCSDPDAEEKFKKISEVYQILSDEKLRQKYNEFGPNPTTTPEGGFADPESFFKQCFGGDRFVDIIGEISLARDFKNMMIDGEEETEVQLSPEEKKLKDKADSEQRERELNERINVLAKNLIDKMSSYTEHETRDSEEKFRQKIISEVEELKYESFGVELLHTIGNIYSLKAKRYLDSQQSHRIFNFAKETGHFFTDTYSTLSDTYSTLKSTIQLQKTGTSLRDADKNGIDQAEKDQLEQEFATKGLNVMWQGSRLEVMGVIRQVCDRILGDTAIPKSRLMSRARGLSIIGDLYLACEPVQPPTEEVPQYA